MKKLLIILLFATACSPSITSVRVETLDVRPREEIVTKPVEEDPKGKFITRVTQVAIVVLSFLTVNNYIR